MAIAPAVVHLVRTGVANAASIAATFERLGVRVQDARDAGEIERATSLVLPGVGAFGAGMAALRERGWVDAIRARVEAGRATLCVCLGMQLLCATSEETPGEEGLGVVPARVERFTGPARVPQMGWNRVRGMDGAGMVAEGAAYFANSYRVSGSQRGVIEKAGWSCAMSEYGGAFVSALERGGVLACQFHPELSGSWGRAVVERWLARAQIGEHPTRKADACAQETARC